MKDRRLILCLFYLAAILSLNPANIFGEQLPIRSYTIADGLARDHVNRVVQDSRGFVWFCTSEGLSRYDGYSFVNYGTEQGLPNRAVNDLLETRDGTYWIATNGGMAIFIPSRIESQEPTANQRFKFVMLNPKEPTLAVNKIMEDASGSIWCATDNGLYRIQQVNGQWNAEFIQLQARAGDVVIRSVTPDSDGSLWILADGLYHRDLEGHIVRYLHQEGLPSDAVRALLKDRDEQFWAATDKGLCRFTIAPDGGRVIVTRLYTTADGLLSNDVWSMLQTADGRLWVTTTGGLNRSESSVSAGVLSFRGYTTREGLNDNAVITMTEDRVGNVWLGTDAGGAAQIVNSGFTSYGANDGLSSTRISVILEDRDGNLRVGAANPDAFLNRFDNGRFVPITTRLPNGAKYSWGWYQVVLQDREGDWWIATADGLYRYGRSLHADPAMDQGPKAIYRKKDGLTDDEVFRVFEDSRGDIWFSTLGNIEAALGRWERSSQSFHQYSPQQDGVPHSAATAFAEDRNGDIWIGFYEGGIARYRGGKFTVFNQDVLTSLGLIRGLFIDSKGRLWIASSNRGLVWSNDPGSENPSFENLTVAQGLSSNQVSCVIEGNDGRLYIGTGRGLDEFDSNTGRLKHYTATDGLADNFVNVSYRDRSGVLWFGTLRGLTRLNPVRTGKASPTQTLITGVRAGNGPFRFADLGAAGVAGIELDPNENRIEVSFVSIGLTPGEVPRYQYMLEGADRDWGPATQQHSVNYANLAPGTYRFLVRSVSSAGTTSFQPASISFRVLTPVWRRWWFIALGLLVIGAAVFALDRYRVSRTREVRSALSMSQKLTSELITQRAELSIANRTLALEFAVTSILAEASTPAEAGARILQAICESSGWDLGALWYVDPQSSQLKCAEIWHGSKQIFSEFEDLTRRSVFSPGIGLPGRVWSTGEPIWIERLAADSNFPRQAAAARDGLKSAFGFPILLENEVTGVSEFFSHEIRRRDDEFLALLSSIGSQIGQLLERRQAEEALRESEDRFRTLAETASDPIITIDEESNIVFVNSATQKVFGYERYEMLGSELTMLMPDYLRELHRAGFRRYCETGQKHLSWEAVELPGLHKSGREIPLEVSFGEFRTNGKHYFTGIARDITERKRAAEALQRSREERLRELETVRQRIATDLHDDIGSSLTQISILSEVVQSNISASDTRATKPLSLIANASRELIDAMSDIVWAINPQKDHLSDLTQRMRRFASDIFTARNVQFHFKVPPGEHDLPLGANIRREVFLVFKESVNNMIKHSGLTESEIEFVVDEREFTLTISDNGKGFDPANESDGHGLMSMRERTHAIGGQLKVDSKPAKGTTITLTVPRENHGPAAA